MIPPEVGDKTLTVPAQSVDGKQIPISVPIGTPQVGDMVTLIPTAGDSVKYTAAVTTTPAVGDTVAVVPLQGESVKWAAITGVGAVKPIPGATPIFRGNLVTGVSYPIDVAVDDRGNVYVLDSGSYTGSRGAYSPSRVLKFSSSGELVSSWTTAANGAECFEPGGIAVQGETVYIADSSGFRIVMFTLSGALKGVFGFGPNYFGYGSCPERMAVTSSGTIYASRNGYPGRDVIKISPSGSLVDNWGASGVNGSPSGSWWPAGIAVDDSERVYVAYETQGEIRIFNGLLSFGGPVITQWAVQDQHCFALTLSPTGEIYVGDPLSHKILVYSKSGSYITGVNGGTQFSNPSGIAIDRSGNIYVADPENKRVIRYGGWSIPIPPPVIYSRDPYKIMVIPVEKADRTMITSALAGIPAGVWSFTFSTTAAPGTDWNPEPDHGGLPWPVRDCAIALGSILRFPGCSAVGLGDPHRASVLMLATESVADLTQRIWHELLHGVTGIESPDTMHSSTGFITWMTANHPGHPFLADSVHYPNTTEVLLWWDEYLTGTIPGISKT